MVKGNRWKR